MASLIYDADLRCDCVFVRIDDLLDVEVSSQGKFTILFMIRLHVGSWNQLHTMIIAYNLFWSYYSWALAIVLEHDFEIVIG